MSDDGRSIAVLGFICFLIGLGMGATIGAGIMMNSCHQSAIEAGAGRWQIDPKTGSFEFKYGVSDK